MAAITISSPGGAQTNPTDTVIPFNNGGIFGDSMLQQAAPFILTAFNPFSSAGSGILIDNTNGIYKFGDIDGNFNGSYFSSIANINTISSEVLRLNVDNIIEMNGLLTDVSAGGSAGLHLKLTINGTKYKIQLLDD
jgi:hypothetical protein